MALHSNLNQKPNNYQKLYKTKLEIQISLRQNIIKSNNLTHKLDS